MHNAKILVIGSFNLDYVFNVERFVRAKETMTSNRMSVHYGGKGFNQAVALARCFEQTYFAAHLNHKERYMEAVLKNNGIKTDYLKFVDEPTGMAFIQVDGSGENCILLNKGANHSFSDSDTDAILKDFSKGDLLVLQNEINDLQPLIKKAKYYGLKIALNPSPFTPDLLDLDLRDLDYLLINEVEGEQLTSKTDPEEIVRSLVEKSQNSTIILTLGSKGVLAYHRQSWFHQEGRKVEAIDTTAAGDTFTGYLLGMLMQGEKMETALKYATYAASLSVMCRGAFESIPKYEDVEELMK